MKANAKGKIPAVISSILIVGEGYAEEGFMNYLKSTYYSRGTGFTVKIMNARGKGAEHVIDYTIRQQQQRSYSVVAVLFDTDTAWTTRVQKDAKKHGLVILPCQPCLEFELLKLHNIEVLGDSRAIKSKFIRCFGTEAHLISDWGIHFPVSFLKSSILADSSPFGRLVKLFEIGHL